MMRQGIWKSLYRLTVPCIHIGWIAKICLIALLGALIAGIYGILHDQITFTLSPEYYTKVKFYQFHYLPKHVPDRVRVGMIGFLATAGMGGICGWFLSRIAVPRHPFPFALRLCLRSFALLFLITLIAGVIGYVLSPLAAQDTSKWENIGYLFGIEELTAFIRVATIHQTGYAGAFIGLLVCCVRLYRMPPTSMKGSDEPHIAGK